MQKFLKITNAPISGQLISLDGVKAAAQVGADVYEAIVEAMDLALQTSWLKPYYVIALPKAVTSIVNA